MKNAAKTPTIRPKTRPIAILRVLLGPTGVLAGLFYSQVQ